MGVLGCVLGVITIGLYILVDHHYHTVSFVLTHGDSPKPPHSVINILQEVERFTSDHDFRNTPTAERYHADEGFHQMAPENQDVGNVVVRGDMVLDGISMNKPARVDSLQKIIGCASSDNTLGGKSVQIKNSINTLDPGPGFVSRDKSVHHIQTMVDPGPGFASRDTSVHHIETPAVLAEHESTEEKVPVVAQTGQSQWDTTPTAQEENPATLLAADVTELTRTATRAKLKQVHTVNQGGDRLCLVPSRSGSLSQTPCNMDTLPPRFLPEDVSVVEVSDLPINAHYMPEIGNGHVATVVQGNTIYMNGLYNGANTTSHRARIPSTTAVMVTIVSPAGFTTRYRMDFGRAVFSEIHTADDFTVTVNRYAHRELTRLMVTEVIVNRTDTARPVTLAFTMNNGSQSEDIDFEQRGQGLRSGKTKEPEYADKAPVTDVAVMYSEILANMTFDTIVQAYIPFITSVSVVQEEAIECWNQGMSRAIDGQLMSTHVTAWDKVWQEGRIDLQGNTTMALSTYATLYYLMSSVPIVPDNSWPFVGMAPGGLAHGALNEDYMGHVFWDQDTWMFPPITLLHADVGRILVGTRLRTHQAALDYALVTGFKGARYPWESAFTGLNVCPSQETTVYENHITGDTAWMMLQYIQQTNDTDFILSDGGFKVLSDIAAYWLSRVTFNDATKLYEIRDAMGPDEWHFPINNSVYTNVIAAQALIAASYAAFLTNQTQPADWLKVAENMYVPFDMENQYHPEFDGYPMGTNVKQADAILLGFPLEWPMSEEVRMNDLKYYATVTPSGPAMTWGMFAVGWIRLGLQYKHQADAAFYRGTYNIQNPFKVWSENADGTGAMNFHTGMGGYLQSLLFGYAGFDIGYKYLTVNPVLPPSITRVSVVGFDYAGSSFDLAHDGIHMNVTLTRRGAGHLVLWLVKDQDGHFLEEGVTVTATCQTTYIFQSVE